MLLFACLLDTLFADVEKRGGQWCQSDGIMRVENGTKRYADALPSLLKMLNEETSARFDVDPLYISELTDERLLRIRSSMNVDDQPNLEFPEEERDALSDIWNWVVLFI